MPERFTGEQGKITALEGKVSKEQQAATKEEREDKTKSLREKLAAERSTYFGSVNSITDELKTAKSSLKDPQNKASIDSFADMIQQRLADAAQTGESIYAAQMADKKGSGLQKLSESARLINVNVEMIEESVPFFLKMEQIESSRSNKILPAKQKVNEILSNEKLSHKEKKEASIKAADSAIDIIADSKKILKGISSVSPLHTFTLALANKNVNKDLREMELVKEYYVVQEYTEQDDISQYLIFDPATGKIKKTDAFLKLLPEEQQRILREMDETKKNNKSETGEKCATSPEEKGYFEAKQLMFKGKPLEAKAKFLVYWRWMRKKHWIEGKPEYNGINSEGMPVVYKTEGSYDGKMTDEEVAMHDSSEMLLQQIALSEIAQARLRFDALRSSLNQWHGTSVGDVLSGDFSRGLDKNSLGLNSIETQMYLSKMERILDRAESMVKHGGSLSLENVLHKLRTMKPGSQNYSVQSYQSYLSGSEFDVLSIQSRLNQVTDPEQKRQMALQEAKKALKMGLPDIARLYYKEYFKPVLEKAKKKVSRSEIEAKMRSEGSTQMRIFKEEPKIRENIKKSFREQKGSEIPDDQLDTLTYQAKERMFQTAVSAAYMKHLRWQSHLDIQNLIDNGDSSAETREWNENYCGTFLVLDKIDDPDRHWADPRGWEPWKFTPEEWQGFLTQLWVDIGLLVVSLGVGNIAKTATMRTALTYAARKTGKPLLIEGAEQAFKKGGQKAYYAYIVKELGWKRAAALGLLAVGAESGASTVSNIALQKALRDQDLDGEQAMKTWGRMALSMGVSRIANVGVPAAKAGEGALKSASRFAGEVVLEETATTSLEVAFICWDGNCTPEQVSQALRENVGYAVGVPSAMRGFRSLATNDSPVRFTAADKKIKLDYLKGEFGDIGANVNRPLSVKGAKITDDGLVINGQLIEGNPRLTLESLPPAVRDRVLDLAPRSSAVETHLISKFRTDEDLLKDPEVPEHIKQEIRDGDFRGWIDGDGFVHYSLTHLNDGHYFGPDAVGGGSPYRRPPGEKIMPDGYKCTVNDDGPTKYLDPDGTEHTIPEGAVFVVGPDGTPMPIRNFLKTDAGKDSFLYESMLQTKQHESTHLVIEYAYTKLVEGDDGKPVRVEDTDRTQPIIDMFAKPGPDGSVPDGKIPLRDHMNRPMELNWQNVQEYLAHVGDGSKRTDPTTKDMFETILAEHIPGFSFDKARNLSAQLIGTHPAEALGRLKAAAKGGDDGPVIEIDGMDISIKDSNSLVESINKPKTEEARKQSSKVFQKVMALSLRLKGAKFSDLHALLPHMRTVDLMKMVKDCRDQYDAEYAAVSKELAAAHGTRTINAYADAQKGFRREVVKAIRAEVADSNKLLSDVKPDGTNKSAEEVRADLDMLASQLRTEQKGLGSLSASLLINSPRGLKLLSDLASGSGSTAKRVKAALSKMDMSTIKMNAKTIDFLSQLPNGISEIRARLRSGEIKDFSSLPPKVKERMVDDAAEKITAQAREGRNKLMEKTKQLEEDMKDMDPDSSEYKDAQYALDNIMKLQVAYERVAILDSPKAKEMITNLESHKHDKGYEDLPKLTEILMANADSMSPDFLVTLMQGRAQYDTVDSPGGPRKVLFLEGRFLGQGTFGGTWSTAVFEAGSTKPNNMVFKKPKTIFELEHVVTDYKDLDSTDRSMLDALFKEYKDEGIHTPDGYDNAVRALNKALDRGSDAYKEVSALLLKMQFAHEESVNARHIMAGQTDGKFKDFVAIHHVSDSGAIFMESIAHPKLGHKVCEFADIMSGDIKSLDGKNPISREQFWGLFADMLDAVHRAHKEGVVHRDLKPENFGVGPDGRIRIIDLGSMRTKDSIKDINWVTIHGTDIIPTPAHKDGRTTFHYPERGGISPAYYDGQIAFNEASGVVIPGTTNPRAKFGASDNFALSMVLGDIIEGGTQWFSPDKVPELEKYERMLKDPQGDPSDIAFEMRIAMNVPD